jgi:phosphatidylglycerol:prolipoprotein diacylglycerol transferase
MLRRQARVHAMSYTVLYRTTLAAFICALAGARILHVLLVEPVSSIGELFDASQGTMYYGFLLGAAVGSVAYLRATKRSAVVALDACIPAWLVMQIAGRIGCYLAGCCYGVACDLPWSVTFSHSHSQAPSGIALHPTQLYEALGIALILLMLLRIERRGARRGVVTFAYLSSYAFLRFLLEFLRADDRGMIIAGALSIAQGISLVILPLAVVALLAIGIRRPTQFFVTRS